MPYFIVTLSSNFGLYILFFANKSQKARNILKPNPTFAEDEPPNLGFSSNNIPTDARNKLKSLNDDNKIINRIVFSQNDGWVILFGESGVTHKNIPEDAVAKILELTNNKDKINFIRFFGNNWIIIYNNYEFATNF